MKQKISHVLSYLLLIGIFVTLSYNALSRFAYASSSSASQKESPYLSVMSREYINGEEGVKYEDWNIDKAILISNDIVFHNNDYNVDIKINSWDEDNIEFEFINAPLFDITSKEHLKTYKLKAGEPHEFMTGELKGLDLRLTYITDTISKNSKL